jgi:hypothetical protein
MSVTLSYRQQQDFLDAVADDARFCREALQIRDESGHLVKMNPRPGQIKLFNTIREQREKNKAVRLVVLKTRRSNFTAGVCAAMFKNAITWPGRKGLIVADNYKPAGLEAFGYLQAFQANYVPFTVHGKALKQPALERDTDMNMRWESKASLEVLSADKGELRGGGRQDVLCDEAAFWRDPATTLTGVLNMVPSGMPGTMVIVQSTANGIGGEFYDLCQKAMDPLNESGWRFLFFGWLEHTPYRIPVDDPVRLMASLDKEEKVLMSVHGATLEQLAWRRLKISTECRGRVEIFHQEYPTTPQEAFLASGRPRFDHPALSRMVITAGISGEIEVVEEFPRQKTRFHPREFGALTVWRMPEAGRRYCAGADPSHGIDVSPDRKGMDPDYAVMWVEDFDTGEQVAMLRDRLRPHAFAEYSALLCQWYNWAYLCPEANDPGFIDALVQFYRVELLFNRRRDPTDRRSAQPEEIGWQTTGESRLWLVSAVDDAIREGTSMIHSAVALDEHYKFVIKPNGKAEAQAGGHDDTVLAHAFCKMMRRYYPRHPAPYVDNRLPSGHRPGVVRYGQPRKDDDD